MLHFYQRGYTGLLSRRRSRCAGGCQSRTWLWKSAGNRVIAARANGARSRIWCWLRLLLAARAVGPTGKVIGVDMTHEMLARARKNAKKNGFSNVEFRLGEIEALPVADESVDVIISNCVINLSPEKQRVFNEAFRVLKPAGRLAVADMVATAPLPNYIKADWAAYTGCMAGASQITELERMLHASGFKDIKIAPKDSSRSFVREWLPGKRVEDYLVSATIEAVKP